MNKIIYGLVVLIWGSTWLAISLQSGIVPVPAEVFHRFVPAALLMILITKLRGELRIISRRDIFFAFLQGLCHSSLNFILFYTGIKYITGGMESLIFSTAVILNIVFCRIFWKQKAPDGIWLAVALGFLGLILILYQDLTVSSEAWKGILLSFGGTICFSLGNMVGIRQKKAGLSPILAQSYSMPAGVLILVIVMLITKTPFYLPLDKSYICPVLYLAVLGSVGAFTLYLHLVNEIGAQKTAFTTVLTPFLALILAVLFEGESLTVVKLFGGILIICSNIIGLGGLRRYK